MAESNITGDFDGFQILSGMLQREDGSDTGDADKIDTSIPYKDPEELDKEEPEDNKTVDDETGEEESSEEESEESEEGEVSEEDEESEEDSATKLPDEVKELEGDLVNLVVDQLVDQIGLDLEDDSKPQSVEELVEVLTTALSEEVEPEYSSDEVKQIDEYVKNGGKLEDLFQVKAETKSIESLDPESETDQKVILREALKVRGYSDSKIERAIGRYEDAGVLADEAEDAYDFLKDYTKKEEQKLLEQQRKYKETMEQRQQEFISNVQEVVESIDSVAKMPVKLSKNERKEIFDYIFKVDADGQTQFQKEFGPKELVETAVLRKFGDKLMLKAKSKGEKDAYKQFHQRLKSAGSKRKGSTAPRSREGSDDGLVSFSKLLG